MTRDTLVASVPWPVHLFGGLHALPGMGTISVATDLRTGISASARSDRVLSVEVAGLPGVLTFDLDNLPETTRGIPSLGMALKALRAINKPPRSGFDFRIYSRVPDIGRHLDSPALVAAWTVTLLALHGGIGDYSGGEIAEIACRALRGSPAEVRGRAEVYTCVLGGTLFIKHGEKPEALPIERQIPGIILGFVSSRRPKIPAIEDTLLRVAGAFQSLKQVHAGIVPGKVPLDDVVPGLGQLSAREAGIVYAYLELRDLCSEVGELLESECGCDDDRLGEMLDRGHELLRDYLGFSTPPLEKLVQTGKLAGALGCKVIPGTGSFIAFAPGCEEDIVTAIKKARGDAHLAAVSDGIRVET